jgi:hypothetical protein
MNYDVVFILDDKRKVEQYEGPNPGTAFAKCLKFNPSAKLISAHVHRKAAGGCEMWQDFPAPSTISVVPIPEEKFQQTEMKL